MEGEAEAADGAGGREATEMDIAVDEVGEGEEEVVAVVRRLAVGWDAQGCVGAMLETRLGAGPEAVWVGARGGEGEQGRAPAHACGGVGGGAEMECCKPSSAGAGPAGPAWAA